MHTYSDHIADLRGLEQSECAAGTYGVVNICTKYTAAAIQYFSVYEEANTTSVLYPKLELENCIVPELITLFLWGLNILWFIIQLLYFVLRCRSRCVRMKSNSPLMTRKSGSLMLIMCTY